MLSRLSPLICCALFVAVGAPAHAFHPEDPATTAAEPARLQPFTPSEQDRLAERPAWQRFLKHEGQAWRARFDERTGAPLRMLGGRLAIDVTSASTVERDLRDLLARHPDALRAAQKDLGPARIEYSADLDIRYVELPATRAGLPIYRGGVTARIKAGELVMLGVQAYRDAPLVGRGLLDRDTAFALAIDQGPHPSTDHDPLSARQVWLPRDTADGVELVRTWQIITATAAPPGRWVSFVDADTGELLSVHDEIRWIDGTIEGLRNPRRPNQGLRQDPLSRLQVSNELGESTLTDDDGVFTLDGSRFFASLRGPDVAVVEAGRGRVSEVEVDGTSLVFDDRVVSQTEIDSFAAVREVRRWADAVAPEVVVGDFEGGVLVSNVNRRDGNCNAFYDGSSINFYTAGGGCVNTGQLADVTYHEWGHGFHATSLRAGSFDGSISEGAADSIAFLITDDSMIGRGFFNTDTRGIREVDQLRVYPRDVVGQVHTDGLILGGTIWDLVARLEGRYSRDEARDVAGRILAGALKGGPTLATVGEELLLADDDDGDLSNGSPHYCELTQVLAQRGLLPASSPPVALRHDQLVEAEPDRVTLTATVEAQLADCYDLDRVEAVYRVGGGSWRRTEASSDGRDLQARIEGLAFGSFVEYYLDTDQVSIPEGGERNPLSLYVGGVLPLGCQDFEDSDGGYAHELISGTPGPGADDWQWDWPRGRSGDPSRANSGRNIWGTDLGLRIDGQRYDGAYQDDKHTRLTSPVLRFPEHLEGVALRYARWLTVQDGSNDLAQILADGEVVWTNHVSGDAAGDEHHLDARWVQHSVDLGEATADGAVELAWELITDEGGGFGGWNLDDVCLFAPATPNNRLAIVDFQARAGDADGVALRWTHPEWAPVTEVLVVRTQGEPPTGPADGTPIYSTQNPDLGAPAVAYDLGAELGEDYWYAVYARDGEDWLGWTVEGRNLASARGTGGGIRAAGCGCTTASAPSLLGMLPFALLLFVRRRRNTRRG